MVLLIILVHLELDVIRKYHNLMRQFQIFLATKAEYSVTQIRGLQHQIFLHDNLNSYPSELGPYIEGGW